MSSLIYRTIAPPIVVTMLLFSVFVLLRGHNEPGGGFIGGLIAAAAVATYGMARGVPDTRRRLRVQPIAVAGLGVLVAGLSGLLSLATRTSFLTGLWISVAGVSVSTPILFDIGVYLVVFGTLSAVALALEEPE